MPYLGMIRLAGFICILGVIVACNSTNHETPSSGVDEVIVEQKAPMELLRHVVLFKFNDEATPEIVTEIEESFAGLADKIPAIHSFEWGINNSPEGLSKGLTHCFLVTFASEEDRQIYLPHPDHQDFVKFIGPYVDDVTVVDYWIK